MTRIRVLALAVGLFLALTLGACEQPRPCAVWHTQTTVIVTRSGKTTTVHPITMTTCERYADAPQAGH